MPIRDKSLYPPDWDALSRRIRFERAKGMCEQCGAPHAQIILRSLEDSSKFLIVNEAGEHCDPTDGTPYRMSEIPDEYDGNVHLTKVILTVAHLDHNPANNAEGNLKALCQRCHLVHDGKQHARNAARTRQINREKATGQMRLIE